MKTPAYTLTIKVYQEAEQPKAIARISPQLFLNPDALAKALDDALAFAQSVDGDILAGGTGPQFRVPTAKAQAAASLRTAGFSYSDIGRALSVSKQHAHRLVKAGNVGGKKDGAE